MTLRRALTLLTLAVSALDGLCSSPAPLFAAGRGLRAEYFDTAALGARPAIAGVDDDVSAAQMTRRREDDLPDVFRVR